MGANLNPNPNDTTNALLKILIDKVDNNTFSKQDASLPIWTGPSSSEIWIQTLAYTSLSTSLLAAFGAVLCKQWLDYFNASRFGKGSLDERCKRRQRKLDGLEHWQFNAIISTLPIFLQLSLLFFGISLSADIWTQQHTVASLIIGTTALGFGFYTFTVIASLQSDCPFQTPISTVIKRSRQSVSNIIRRGPQDISSVLRRVRQGVARMFRPAHWETPLDSLRHTMRGAFRYTQGLIYRLHAYQSRIMRTVRPPSNDPESFISSQELISSRDLWVDLVSLDSPVKLVDAHSVQRILETTTDMEMLTAAVSMVPEVEWPDEYDVLGVLERLKNYLYGCFDSTRQLLPLTQERAMVCLKAMCHLLGERGPSDSFQLYANGIFSKDHQCFYEILLEGGILISCMERRPIQDWASLSASDRLWLTHMFTYILYKGGYDSQFKVFVIVLISDSLRDSTSPGRLDADCLLSAGLLLGLSIDRRYLARLDKRYSHHDLSICLTILQLIYLRTARLGYHTPIGYSLHCSPSRPKVRPDCEDSHDAISRSLWCHRSL